MGSRDRRSAWRALLLGGVLAGSPAGGAAAAPAVVVRLGLAEDGSITPEWRGALAPRLDPAVLARVEAGRRPLSAAEREWQALVESRASAWRERIPSLLVPYGELRLPATVVALLGNQGGDDGFTSGLDTVCFDLARLVELYGSPRQAENRERLDRFFAHELSHLLHKAWRERHPVGLETPFDRALWHCFYEGFGNYRSLSSRWLGGDGGLTPHARGVLARLAPVFVARLRALREAGAAEEEALTRISRAVRSSRSGARCPWRCGWRRRPLATTGGCAPGSTRDPRACWSWRAATCRST